jgi:hypothetical protein
MRAQPPLASDLENAIQHIRISSRDQLHLCDLLPVLHFTCCVRADRAAWRKSQWTETHVDRTATRVRGDARRRVSLTCHRNTLGRRHRAVATSTVVLSSVQACSIAESIGHRLARQPVFASGDIEGDVVQCMVASRLLTDWATCVRLRRCDGSMCKHFCQPKCSAPRAPQQDDNCRWADFCVLTNMEHGTRCLRSTQLGMTTAGLTHLIFTVQSARTQQPGSEF